MKVVLATQKPFSAEAVGGIREVLTTGGHELALLEGSVDEDAFLDAVGDADGLIVRSDRVTASVVDRAPLLKIVVRAGAGYDNVDLARCTERGIVVMNTPGQNSGAVAELALGLMIFMARGGFSPGTGTELRGKTLGIHAFGNVGRLVAELGRGFGMHILAFDPFVSSAMSSEATSAGVEFVTSVEELYRRSDYVSLHVPATRATVRSVGYELLMSMPKGGTLINTARGEVIDEVGLERALAERVDLKYATDIAPERDFAGFGRRFFATAKKMGAETSEANVNAGLAAARQVVDFFATGAVRYKVN